MSKVVISIGREFGSGGRKIGQELAESLGIPCYDRHLIEGAEVCSGYEKKELEHADEMKANRFLYKTPSKANPYTGYGKPVNDTLFVVQSKLIKQYAEEGSCVIVGWCADKIRRNYYSCYSKKNWGDKSSYDLMIDSSRFTHQEVALMLKAVIEERIKGQENG